ncbi:hypothetical protein EJA61_07240 [Salmonella enterica]|nr:hypothetical protein [Salmonella enterica]EDE2211661.1 hypothetical protein [Salmonella enterica]EFP4758132.1 hypothetical protein [Salmonella enterica]EFP4790131.1 hypothetical protein [Salmonella enterica]HBC7087891.1 hypothetical protein [Citrobacter freundii]
MGEKYLVKNATLDTDPQNLVDEVNALKFALAATIFSQSSEGALSAMRSLKENKDPAVQKLFKELMQFSPANAE